jgi:hypothetical protein
MTHIGGAIAPLKFLTENEQRYLAIMELVASLTQY